MQVSERLCPLVHRACEEDAVAREVTRPAVHHGRKSEAAKSQGFLACSLFHVCVALREFFDLRKKVAATASGASAASVVVEPKFRFQDWFLPVLTAWLGVVRDRVSKNNVPVQNTM